MPREIGRRSSRPTAGRSCSTRIATGKWGPWIIGLDGGGLRKLAEPPTGAVYVFVSPKGDADRLHRRTPAGASITRRARDRHQPRPNCQGTTVDGKFFSPTSWSPDGKQLAGNSSRRAAVPSGVGIYDLATNTTTIVSTTRPMA